MCGGIMAVSGSVPALLLVGCSAPCCREDLQSQRQGGDSQTTLPLEPAPHLPIRTGPALGLFRGPPVLQETCLSVWLLISLPSFSWL